MSLIRSLEAAYQVASHSDRWLEDVVAAVAPHLDVGLGVHGLRVRFQDAGRELAAPVLVGGTEAWQEQWRANWWEPVIEAVDAHALRAMLGFGVVSSAQQLWDAAARGIPTLDAHLAALSERGWAGALRRPGTQDRLFYVDSLNLCALEPSGDGIAIIANRDEILSPSTLRSARRRFARVASHVATALRARRALEDRPPTATDGEAILTTDGRMLHARGAATSASARAALQNAARDIDRVRAGRTDDDEALALWKCLVDGRWTLLDEFESDGKRYVIALPNEPHEPSTALSPRESQVLGGVARGLSNKEIAYVLGLAPSTVATLVARGAKKLGAKSRVALVRRVRAEGGLDGAWSAGEPKAARHTSPSSRRVSAAKRG